jgi:hypothetical protein
MVLTIDGDAPRQVLLIRETTEPSIVNGLAMRMTWRGTLLRR